MDETRALKTLSAVAQPTRLRIVTLLATAGDEGLTSSAIADAVSVPRNLASSHLAILSAAGVATADRHGRTATYRLAAETMRALACFLAETADRSRR